MKKKTSKPSEARRLASRVGVQFMKIDEKTIGLIAIVEGATPDIPETIVALMALRTMKRHLDAKLAEADKLIAETEGAVDDHSITPLGKDKTDTLH